MLLVSLPSSSLSPLPEITHSRCLFPLLTQENPALSQKFLIVFFIMSENGGTKRQASPFVLKIDIPHGKFRRNRNKTRHVSGNNFSVISFIDRSKGGRLWPICCCGWYTRWTRLLVPCFLSLPLKSKVSVQKNCYLIFELFEWMFLRGIIAESLWVSGNVCLWGGQQLQLLATWGDRVHIAE